MEPTHASFFSGVGGLDLGLERAGWRTVSFSEIDPYASAVLAERWPSIPNLGDITDLASAERWREAGQGAACATLLSGGFPCQDLSVAGKRAGFTGQRSVLAFAFLDLVERYRPPAVLLENVPGLLSSHRGRDMAALLGRLVELGYGVAYRVLDARHFGVPQRRRRVFILGLRSDPDDPDGRVAAERAAAVLSVGTRCRWHPPTGIEAGSEDATTTQSGIGSLGNIPVARTWNTPIAPSLSTRQERREHPGDVTYIVGASPDPRRNGAPDGLARRLDDHELDDHELAPTLRVGAACNEDGGPGETVPIIVQSLDTKRGGPDDNEAQAGHLITKGNGVSDDPLLPLGLDSHRYRCCGNGVVAPVAEWIGRQLLAALERAV